jgi:hypothetical protein
VETFSESGLTVSEYAIRILEELQSVSDRFWEEMRSQRERRESIDSPSQSLGAEELGALGPLYPGASKGLNSQPSNQPAQ